MQQILSSYIPQITSCYTNQINNVPFWDSSRYFENISFLEHFNYYINISFTLKTFPF